MDEFNVVPLYRQGFNEISDGFDIKASDFCKKSCCENKRCRQFYEMVCKNGEKHYVCPYGFNVYAFESDSDLIIFTSMRIEGKYDKSKVIPKLSVEERKNIREITEEKLNIYVNAHVEFLENKIQYEKYKNSIDEIFHDIRKFNKQIKLKNDRLFKLASNIKKPGGVIEVAKGIQETCWFLTVRLNNFDFLYNEEILKSSGQTSFNIYKIFDKINKCLKEKRENKFVEIRIDAYRECQDMKAYDCIELLPFILLDNAIKYALARTKIDICIKENKNVQNVTVKSIGPYLDENEISKVFNRGYRGNGAKEMTADGLGIGLYTAKRICDLHNINIIAQSADNIYKEINGIKYSEFTIDFSIKL